MKRKAPKTQTHELLVMARVADLYATLPPAARKRVHGHLGEILCDLPVIAEVVDDAPLSLPLAADHA